MLNINNINLDDFYFNNNYLSSFEGMVAGKGDFSPCSSTPSKTIQTEKIPNRDGEFVYGSTYNPRTFVVPITIMDLSKLRDISKWLDVKTPTTFYYANDKIYIKAMFDGAIDFEHGYIQGNLGMNIGGVSEIKFIAHDPFYYLIDDLKYVISKFDRTYSTINPLNFYNAINITTYDRYAPADFELTNVDIKEVAQGDYDIYADGNITKNNNLINMQTNDFSTIKIFNDGNKESYPIIKINTSQLCDVTIGINGEAFSIKNVNGYVTIDSLYETVLKGEENKYFDMEGEFSLLQDGYNLISIVGTYCTGIEIQCRSRWI